MEDIKKIHSVRNTQRNFVIEQLGLYGYVSRNTYLLNYISRLGAIICLLKKEGYHFRTERIDGDYVYFLELTPDEDKQLTREKLIETVEQGIK